MDDIAYSRVQSMDAGITMFFVNLPTVTMYICPQLSKITSQRAPLNEHVTSLKEHNMKPHSNLLQAAHVRINIVA